MENHDKQFMRIALREAEASLRKGGIPVGAVVVMGNKVIAVGRRHRNNDAYLDHAEVRALKQAYKRVGKNGKKTIYTTLEPCVMCFGTILHGRIDRLVYGLEDPLGGATKIKKSMLPMRNKLAYPKIKGGVLREESRELLVSFLKKTKDPFWLDKTNPLVKLIKNN